MVTAEPRHAQTYNQLLYHLIVVRGEKNPAKNHEGHVKETLSIMETSQASSEGIFQQGCKGQDE